MPILKFEVQADYDKVIRLRDEIKRLDQMLRSLSLDAPTATIRNIEGELSRARTEFTQLTTVAIKAGAELEDGLKKRIYDASQSVNGLTDSIIAQRSHIHSLESDLRRVGEEYRKIGKDATGGDWQKGQYLKGRYDSLKDEIAIQKDALFGLTQQQAEARLSVKKLRDEYALMKKEAGDGTAVLEEMKKQLLGMGKNMLGTIGVGVGIKEFVGQMIKTRGEFQQIETSLEVLLGSEEKAARLMGEVKELAKVSQLDLKSMAAATQMMLGFNIEAEKVPRFLQAIGDVSMGNAQRFNSLTLAFSQMSATGKLMGQDLNQMIAAGFNPLQVMAEKAGKSIATLKEEMSKGAITSEMVQQAFIDATSAGGKFYQMSERASKNIDGQISMMQDALDSMFNSLGEQSEGVILGAIEATTSLIENYETVGKVIAGLISVYGVYKAALITNIAITKSWAVAARTDAVAKGIQTAATKAATVAQAAFNAVANANPYVLLATAVAAAGAALWVYATRGDKATEAQEMLNKAVDEADAAFASELTNIDTLFNSLRKAKEGTEEYATAQKAIVDQYGTYLTGLVDEKNNLLDVEEAYRRVAVAARDAANARAMEAYTKDVNDKYQETYQSKIGTVRGYLKKGLDGDKLQNTIMRLIQQDIPSGQGLSEDTKAAIKDAVIRSGKWKSGSASFIGQIERLIEDVNEAGMDRELRMEGLSAAFGPSKNGYDKLGKSELERLKKILSDKDKDGESFRQFVVAMSDGSKQEFKAVADVIMAKKNIDEALKKIETDEKLKHDSNFGVQYEAAKKEWEKAKSELEKIEADRDKYTKQQFEQAKQREQAAEAVFKKLNGDTTGKGAKAEAEAARDEARAEAKAEREANKRAEDNLKLMRDWEQAKIDVLKEGTEKEIMQIKLDYERRKDVIDKQERELRKQNGGELSEEQTSAFEAMHKANESNRDKAIQDVYKAEQEARKADLAAMRDYLKQYGTYQQQRLAITEEYAEKIKNAQSEGLKLIYEEQEKSELEGLDEKFGKTTRAMADLFEDASHKSVKSIRAIIDKYELLVAYMSGTGKPDGTMAGKEDLKSAGFSDADIDKIERGEISIKDITDALKNLMGVIEGKSPWETFKTNIGNAITKFKGGKKDVEALSNLMDALSASMSDMLPVLKQFSSDISNILGFDDAKIQGVMDAVNGLGQAAAGVGQAMSGNVGAGVITAASGISKMVSALDGLFGADYSQYNRMVSEYDSLIDVWDVLIAKKKEYIAESYGPEIMKVGDEAEALLNKKIESNRILGVERLNSGASAGSSSIGVRQRKNMTSEGWNELREASKSIGFNYDSVAGGRMTGLFDLTAEQLQQLQEQAPTFWAKLDDDVKEYLQNIIDCNDELEQMKERLNEQLTQISFDSMYDDFVNKLMDMDSSSRDFAENVSEYFMRAMLNNQIGEAYKEKLKGWYEKFANAMKDGTLDEKERKALNDEYMGYVNEAMNIRDNLAAVTGYGSSSYSQEATRGYATQLTEDTGSEISGRLTAVAEGVYQIRDLDVERNELLKSMSGRASGDSLSAIDLNHETLQAMMAQQMEAYTVHTDTRRILAESFLELQQIKENTGAIVKPIKRMNEQLDEISDNIQKAI